MQVVHQGTPRKPLVESMNELGQVVYVVTFFSAIFKVLTDGQSFALIELVP